jgi:2-dehydro-3-deoxyphosphogluconate aldolase / (4S)-4-hydroxy-2-oxoglutarate aldolase
LDPETARAVILAGAKFIVSPTLNLATIAMACRYSVAIFPGAYTPTEILTAWESGADLVKVFPASIGGPDYIKAVKAPLPHVKLLPTGGVNLNTAASFLKAGAYALAVGGNLVDKKTIQRGEFSTITEIARQYVEIVRQTRLELQHN